MINLEQKYFNLLKEIFGYTSNKINCEIVLFGSRAVGNNSQTSDVDLAIKSQQQISSLISILKEEIEESNIPYKVDIVEYSKTSEAMRKNIDKEGIIIWKS